MTSGQSKTEFYKEVDYLTKHTYMEAQNEWIFFKELDLDDPKFNRFNIDTRDFHAGYNYKEGDHKDIFTLSKYSRFFYTKEEVLSEIERLFVESGGKEKGDWRCLELISNDGRVLNWNLKYIRIWRTDKGFLICNSDWVAIPKNVLVGVPVNTKVL